MSGNTDPSTPVQRRAFVLLLTGAGGGALPGAAAAVANCQMPLPLEASDLLGLPPGATYAAGVARMQFRWSNGTAAS